MAKHVFHHERFLTLTLLGVVATMPCVLGYKLIDYGLNETREKVFFSIVMVLLLIVVLQAVFRMLMRITIDRKNKCVVLEYMRYPTWYFDIYPKRRVVVPFAEIASLEHGLMYRGSTHLSWHVHTRSSRFEFPVFMKDEERLRRMLYEIAIGNQIPIEECRYQPSADRFRRVVMIATVILCVAAAAFSIVIIVI